MSFFRSRRFYWIALSAIVAFGFFIRLCGVDHLPAGLYPDEAMNGVNAIGAIESRDYRIFYPDNYGREGLFINLQALTVEAFGPEIVSLRIWSVILGTLAIVGTGFLAYELFRRRSAALIAAFLIASSFWAIGFSRIGFRAIFVPMLLSFSLAFLLRGVRTGSFIPFILSGLLFGAGLHTYVAFRLAPLILIALLPFLMLSYRNFIRRYLTRIFVFVLFAAISAGPMFAEFAAHPEIFSSRSAAVSIFSEEVNHGDFWGTFGSTLGLSLVKYTFFGDQNWRHNFPPYPILDPFTGILFLAGLVFSIGMFVRLAGARLRGSEPDPELAAHALLLIGFFAMLAPEFLTREGLPHALRSIGTQPFVFALATIPLIFVVNRLVQRGAGTRVGAIIMLAVALGGGATWNVVKYFSAYADHPAQHASFDERFTLMARYLRSLPPETPKYVYTNGGGTEIGNGLPITAQPIVYLTHGRVENLRFLRADTDTVIRPPAVIIPQVWDEKLFERIVERIPSAYVIPIDLNPGYGSSFQVIVLP